MSQKAKEDSLIQRLSSSHEHNIDLENRIIYLVGAEQNFTEIEAEPGIDYRMSNTFIKNINLLASIDSNTPVLICMKTCGGDVTEGLAIYDAILTAPMPITVLSYTHARSMSSIVLQAANKRVLMPSSSFMFHMGDLSVAGTPKQVNSYVTFSDASDKYLMEIYVTVLKTAPHGKLRNWSKKKIEEWLTLQMDKKEDVYLTAQEAVEYGFADEIFTSWENIFAYTEEELLRK